MTTQSLNFEQRIELINLTQLAVQDSKTVVTALYNASLYNNKALGKKRMQQIINRDKALIKSTLEPTADRPNPDYHIRHIILNALVALLLK